MSSGARLTKPSPSECEKENLQPALCYAMRPGSLSPSSLRSSANKRQDSGATRPQLQHGNKGQVPARRDAKPSAEDCETRVSGPEGSSSTYDNPAFELSCDEEEVSSRPREAPTAGRDDPTKGLARISLGDALEKELNRARELLRDAQAWLPPCPSSEELISQVEGLLAVAEARVSVRLAGPDARTAAAAIVSAALDLPSGVDLAQWKPGSETSLAADVVVVLVDASVAAGGLPEANCPSPGSIGGRSLKAVTTEGPVGAVLQRACRTAGLDNVFLGVAGCGAEAAGLRSDCLATESAVAEATGLGAARVACFSLPGGDLFGGGAGGGTVGGRKRLLRWCESVSEAAQTVQRQRADQIEALLKPHAEAVEFWREALGGGVGGRGVGGGGGAWAVRRLVRAALEGLPALSMDGAEALAAARLPSGPDPAALRNLVDQQASLTHTASFMAGLGGVFTAPVGYPISAAADFFVRLRLSLALAAAGGYSCVRPQVLAAALCCLQAAAEGTEGGEEEGVEGGIRGSGASSAASSACFVLQPTFVPAAPRGLARGSAAAAAAEEGHREEEEERGSWLEAAVARASCSQCAEVEGRKEEAAVALEGFARRLPLEIVRGAPRLLLESCCVGGGGAARGGAHLSSPGGGSSLGFLGFVPLVGSVMGGESSEAGTRRSAEAAAAAFLPRFANAATT